MRPILPITYYYGRLMGLCPYEWTHNIAFDKILPLRITLLDFFKIFILTSLMCGTFFYNSMDNNEKFDLLKSVNMFTSFLTVTLPILSTVVIWLKKHELIEALDKMDAVGISLNQLGRQVGYRRVKHVQYLICGSVLVGAVFENTLYWFDKEKCRGWISLVVHYVGR